MKKTVIFISIALILLSLCACSSKADTENIDAELQGYWYVSNGLFERMYYFNNGEFMTVHMLHGEQQSNSAGTYNIQEDSIELNNFEYETPEYLPYSYNKDSGRLRVFWDDELSLEMERLE